MKAIQCEKCGSTELYKENGYYICPYCGTKHLISQEDKSVKESSIELSDDVSRLLEKCREEPARAAKYAQLILEIDPNNIEAKKYLSVNNLSNQKSGCYIATSVFQTYDCPQLWTLRRYRDNVLKKTWYGRLFIHLYYKVSPLLVKRFGHLQWFNSFWKTFLNRIVVHLNKIGISNTFYYDH